jgi:hypothetical protein
MGTRAISAFQSHPACQEHTTTIGARYRARTEDFSRGGTGEVDEGLVLDGVLRADKVRVLLLEEFVETVLAGTLHRVTDKSGTDTGAGYASRQRKEPRRHELGWAKD